MEPLSILLGIAAVQFLGAASPGPNFIIVTGYSMSGSRRIGLLVVLGILLATLTWAIVSASGLGALMAAFPSVYEALQWVSAVYLIWIGAKMLMGAARGRLAAKIGAGAPPMTARQAVRTGYVTNITNPKSLAYYSSLFVVMIPSDSPTWLFAAAVGTALLVSTAWWVSVALFFSVGGVRRVYERLRRGIDALFGGLLIAAGVRLATN